jgi:hypothetical protein
MVKATEDALLFFSTSSIVYDESSFSCSVHMLVSSTKLLTLMSRHSLVMSCRLGIERVVLTDVYLLFAAVLVAVVFFFLFFAVVCVKRLCWCCW